MNKFELLKVKGGLKKNGLRVTDYGTRFSFFVLLFLFFFVFSPFPFTLYPFPASADSITIRTIVTPIGSQSEKWGAKGLMVCIVGEALADGGCGPAATIPTGYENDDMLIFKDGNDNHCFDDDVRDTVYEVSGAGGEGEFPEKACVWVMDGCPDEWKPATNPISGTDTMKTTKELGKIFLCTDSKGCRYKDCTTTNAVSCCLLNGFSATTSVSCDPYNKHGGDAWCISNCGWGFKRCYCKEIYTYSWCCPSE